MRCDKLCLLAVLMVVMVVVLAPAPMSAQDRVSDSPKPDAPPIGHPSGQGFTERTEGVLTFYGDRPTFDATFPGLPIEDFENGFAPPGGIQTCPSPIDENTNNACFAPGGILPGIEFATTGPGGAIDFVLMGAGFFGNASQAIVANYFVESTIINFPPDTVGAVGFDCHSIFSASTATIDIFGPTGPLGSTTASCTNAGAFFGVSSTVTSITQILIDSQTDQAEGYDNVAFGAGAVPTMPSWAMLVLVLVLLAIPTVLLRRRLKT